MELRAAYRFLFKGQAGTTLRALIVLLLSFRVLVCDAAFAETSSPAELKSTNKLIVGVFPRRGFKQTLQIFSPLATYLQTGLGRPVELWAAADYTTFERHLAAEEYDLVHLNQSQYIKARDRSGYDAIIQNEEFGEPSLRAAIFVRADSGIDSLQDLRGKTIAFGGNKDAMVSYIIPTFLMRKANILEGDYKEKFASNPPSALMSMIIRESEAAGAGEKRLQLPLIAKRIAPGSVKALAVSDAFSHLPWAVHPRVDPHTKAQLRDLLLALEETEKGRKILSTAKLTGFNPAADADYDMHRLILDLMNAR
ncbi:MAG: phosphate/phosphite/phosphonate ABC transporter substrate-binding protein [Magnetospiraceae bacterium]